MSERTVTRIPPKAANLPLGKVASAEKRLVCGYARVSTDDPEQLTSYEAQIDHYTKFIQGREDWQFVGMYADRDRSGTTTKRREDFNRMIQDAMNGKIQLIITKSVSRFARNTVDSLVTIRMLKEKGIEVYFEKENIYTLDAKGELLITIMSSLAQEESRSISENVTWGQRKRMQDGKVSMPYKHFLGYCKGPDGKPKVVEAQALVVRLIYKFYLQGRSCNYIKRYLEEEGIASPSGKKQWSVSTIMSILQNEKYKGEALLQKTFTVDFLSKKTKVNEGEVPQYYVTGSHPAIIDGETFDLVQSEIQRRAAHGKQPGGSDPYSVKLICSECGSHYGRKAWHSGSKYARHIWRCNHKYEGDLACSTPHIYEHMIRQGFLEAFNAIAADREQFRRDYQAIVDYLSDTEALDKTIAESQADCDVIMGLLKKQVDENAQAVQDQEIFNERYSAMTRKYDTALERLREASQEKQSRTARKARVVWFLQELEKHKQVLDCWDEELFLNIVETVNVYHGGEASFVFRDGSEVTVMLKDK